MLTSEQEHALYLPRTKVERDTCILSKDLDIMVTLSLQVKTSSFSRAYEASNHEYLPGQKNWSLFEPTMIAGQPALLLEPASTEHNFSVLIYTNYGDSVEVNVINGVGPRAMALGLAEEIVGNLVARR